MTKREKSSRKKMAARNRKRRKMTMREREYYFQLSMMGVRK